MEKLQFTSRGGKWKLNILGKWDALLIICVIGLEFADEL